MSHSQRSRLPAFGLSLGFLLYSIGCVNIPNFNFEDEDKKYADKVFDEFEKQEAAPETKIEFVGDHATIAGNDVVVVHGVGLVVKLDGTGEDPPPSPLRTALVEDLTRAGFKNPNQILASPETALVQLTAYLPADVRKGDPFDVEVRLPPTSEATSLAGGSLVEAFLTEKAVVPGRGELKGHAWGIAKGPILIAAGDQENEPVAGLLRRGKILGGGRAIKERPLALFLRSGSRSAKIAKRIASQIGYRFHSHRGGVKESMAKALTDQRIQLQVHPSYKDNYPRYMQVIRNIAYREEAVQQRDRMERLKLKLMDPDTAALAAIQLEAIGPEAVGFLKEGLQSDNPESRFYSAEALAYLGSELGFPELAKAAKDERAFRVYALAALSATKNPAAFHYLQDLLHADSAETRYGAFRALSTIDPDDPLIAGEFMAGGYNLHIIDSKGPPMVHLTKHRVAEVVLFDAEMRFRTPLLFKAGQRITINARSGGDQVVLSRYQVGKEDQTKIVSTKVVDVVRALDELGGSYPDVAQLLAQANQQQNLDATVAIDALPEPGRLYYRTTEDETESTRIAENIAPNLFNDPAKEPVESVEDDSELAGEAEIVDLNGEPTSPRSMSTWWDPLKVFTGLPAQAEEPEASTEDNDSDSEPLEKTDPGPVLSNEGPPQQSDR